LKKLELYIIYSSTINNNNMNKEILIRIDEDNDIYEMIIDGKTYTLDNVYESEFGQLFDELNMSIELL